jgi:hypothetical protein
MFLARVLFFRFHESPRFLVHSGRKEEAAIALTKIAKFNGDEFRITVADVNDDEEFSEGAPVYYSSNLRHSLEHSYRPEESEGLLNNSPPLTRARSTSPIIHRRSISRTSSNVSKPKSNKAFNLLRRWLGVPLKAWYTRIAGLLSGEWRNRTLLIWSIWMTMALGECVLHMQGHSKPVYQHTPCSTSFCLRFLSTDPETNRKGTRIPPQVWLGRFGKW